MSSSGKVIKDSGKEPIIPGSLFIDNQGPRTSNKLTGTGMLCYPVLSVRELSHFYGIIACRYFICMTLYVFLKVSTIKSMFLHSFSIRFLLLLFHSFFLLIPYPKFILLLSSFPLNHFMSQWSAYPSLKFIYFHFLNLWYLLTVQIMDLIMTFTCIYMMYVIFYLYLLVLIYLVFPNNPFSISFFLNMVCSYEGKHTIFFLFNCTILPWWWSVPHILL